MKLTSSGGGIPNEQNTTIDRTILSIKDFIIKSSKDTHAKSNLHEEKIEQATQQTANRERTFIFSLRCITRTLEELEAVFARQVNDANSNDLLQWRNKLSTYDATFKKLTDTYKECLQSPITTAESMETTKNISGRYFQIDEMKKMFSTRLQDEISTRE